MTDKNKNFYLNEIASTLGDFKDAHFIKGYSNRRVNFSKDGIELLHSKIKELEEAKKEIDSKTKWKKRAKIFLSKEEVTLGRLQNLSNIFEGKDLKLEFETTKDTRKNSKGRLIVSVYKKEN